MTSSLHNCTLAAEAWASCVCVHACVRMRAWEYLSTKCICSPTLRRQHMFIMGVDQQGSWDSSPWALAEIRSPCTWLSAGHQSTAVKVAENRVHSWSRGFLEHHLHWGGGGGGRACSPWAKEPNDTYWCYWGVFSKKYWFKTIIIFWLKLLNHTSNIGHRLKC